MIDRRILLKVIGLLSFLSCIDGLARKLSFAAIGVPSSRSNNRLNPVNASGSVPYVKPKKNLGISDEGFSEIYVSRGGTPEENTLKVISMMGGMDKLIGKDDILILKPNAQWWSQGMTNTDSMKQFIELVLQIKGFSGEIIIAENHHYSDDMSRGWTTEKRNGKYNYTELLEYFNNKGYANVTKYHWHDAGPNPQYREGDAGGTSRVSGPEDGDGYVWCEDLVYKTPSGRKCMMTYPVFTSAYSGITVDLKNGAWKNGEYLNRPVRLINFSALNHHSDYAGVTASVKNLMGAVDMTCGYQGTEPEGYYNMHFIGEEGQLNRLSEKVGYYFRRLGFRSVGRYAYKSLKKASYFNFYYTGGALGFWMRNVRFPDLNIITAELVGWGSRTSETQRSQMRTILASRDPVALDYYAAKYVLLEATRSVEGNDYLARLHDPDRAGNVFKKFLEECHKNNIGNIDERNMRVSEYHFNLPKVKRTT